MKVYDLALSDGIMNNDAFKHTAWDVCQESWIELLKDLKFYEDLDNMEHMSYLRKRFVFGASEWMAGKHGSKENIKLLFG